jgi:hypothetical protein
VQLRACLQERFGLTVTCDLLPGGREVAVTNANKAQYVALVTEYHMTTDIRAQIDAFIEVRAGLRGEGRAEGAGRAEPRAPDPCEARCLPARAPVDARASAARALTPSLSLALSARARPPSRPLPFPPAPPPPSLSFPRRACVC